MGYRTRFGRRFFRVFAAGCTLGATIPAGSSLHAGVVNIQPNNVQAKFVICDDSGQTPIEYTVFVSGSGEIQRDALSDLSVSSLINFLSLQGQHPVLGQVFVSAGSAPAQITEVSNPTGGFDFPADSFFDVEFGFFFDGNSLHADMCKRRDKTGTLNGSL